MPPRFRALVIFAAFTGLRWGELVALRREMLILTPEWCTSCEVR
jgi:integrase